ncbi:Sensory box protein/GGDEF family protein (modular protein) [Pseudomonas sp. JV551A1]|uniref:Sensory box protein/GGDEF family protein (Modular protein) n=1 Tax=Pseudomonas inefficax TaxID=2078786 RepID=A0AAQ1P3T5_9PSED|nr:Sensory box protein/GGDEF family protein (modular protein) [Pseudomonas sp. JV551A1]SPO58463.1 Sensory box protein/GGDEF family protein (modular protein) [Pseudomonas inefficax]
MFGVLPAGWADGIVLMLEQSTAFVGAGAPANTGAAGAMYRVASFAGTPAPTGSTQVPGSRMGRMASPQCN